MPSKILKLGEKNEDPGPWSTNILEIGTVGTRKKPCPLCGLWFAEENLTGMSSLKTVLTLLKVPLQAPLDARPKDVVGGAVTEV